MINIDIKEILKQYFKNMLFLFKIIINKNGKLIIL